MATPAGPGGPALVAPAAIPVPPNAPPPIIIPALPDRAIMEQLVSNPQGIAEAFVDLYGHVRQLGNSVQSVLVQHFSSNDINHDQLDQQIEFNRSKLAEHEAKLDQASTLISGLRASETSLKQQLAEAAAKFQNIEGQMKMLAMRAKDSSSLARDERCRSLGLLGASGASAPVYKKWCATVSQICSERYKGARKLLDAAKKCASNTVTMDVMSGLLESETLVEFNHELYGLLSQQTCGSIWTAVDNAQDHVMNGLEAWRVITYGCSPRSLPRAEEIRKAITNGEQGRATSMAELKNKLVHYDSLTRAYEGASEKSLEESIRVIGLKAIMPAEFEHKLIYELNFSEDYKQTREWLDSLVIKHTSSAPVGANQQFPMEIGNISGAGMSQSDALVVAALEKLAAKIDSIGAAPPSIAAVGPGGQGNFAAKGGNAWGQGGKGGKGPGGGKGSCHKCGKPGHFARDCPNPPVPVWKRGPGAAAPGASGAKGANGGNPQSNTLCRNYAKTGKCRFSPNCRFKHVYGALGCLSGVAFEAEKAGKQLPSSLVDDAALTWDENADGYCLGTDREVDVCCHLASEAAILEPSDIAEMKFYFSEIDAGKPSFQGQSDH